MEGIQRWVLGLSPRGARSPEPLTHPFLFCLRPWSPALRASRTSSLLPAWALGLAHAQCLRALTPASCGRGLTLQSFGLSWNLWCGLPCPPSSSILSSPFPPQFPLTTPPSPLPQNRLCPGGSALHTALCLQAGLHIPAAPGRPYGDPKPRQQPGTVRLPLCPRHMPGCGSDLWDRPDSTGLVAPQDHDWLVEAGPPRQEPKLWDGSWHCPAGSYRQCSATINNVVNEPMSGTEGCIPGSESPTQSPRTVAWPQVLG